MILLGLLLIVYAVGLACAFEGFGPKENIPNVLAYIFIALLSSGLLLVVINILRRI